MQTASVLLGACEVELASKRSAIAPQPKSTKYVISADQNRWRDREAKRFGRPAIYHELEFADLLHREIGRFPSGEHFAGVDADAIVHIRNVRPVAHQATSFNRGPNMRPEYRALPRG